MCIFNVRRVSDDPNNSHLAYNSHIGPDDRFIEVLNKDSKGKRDRSVFLNYVAATSLVAFAIETGRAPPSNAAELKDLLNSEIVRLRETHSRLDAIIEALCIRIAKFGHHARGQDVVNRLLPELGSKLRSSDDRTEA